MKLNRDDTSIEARARRRVARKMGFYIHALVFVLVNLGLYALHAVNGSTRSTMLPLWGWGIGLAVHGIVTFIGLQGDGLRAAMLDKEVERLRRREAR